MLTLSQMRKSFEIQKSEKGFVFSGVLDERVMLRDFQMAIPVADNPYEFDFGNVVRSSSAGIVEWLKFVKQYPGPFYYTNCPPWLVNQFNSMADFFRAGKSAVLSLWAPFFCETDSTNKNFLFRVPAEIPLLDDPSKYQIENKVDGPKEFIPDFIPNRYFRFLVQHREGFQKFLKEFIR